MREIKFRTYDKKIKKFHYWDSISQKYDNVFWVMAKDEEMPIGQFTGLHDRNGVEIYEGDVILDPSTKNTYKIVFYDAKFIGYGISKNAAFYSFTSGTHKFCEIIGNIYDNNIITY